MKEKFKKSFEVLKKKSITKRSIQVMVSLCLISFLLFSFLYVHELGEINKEIYEIDEEHYGFNISYYDFKQNQPFEPGEQGHKLMDYDTANRYADESIKNIKPNILSGMLASASGEVWTQMNNFPAGARRGGVSLNISNDLYYGFGMGSTYPFRDWWKYNSGPDSWTQVADGFTDSNDRHTPVGFAIGDNGYVGLGSRKNPGHPWILKKDFWKYDSVNNTWSQLGDFPGVGRKDGIGFAINGKGYLGMGYAGTNHNDMYEYEPSNDTWTSIASYPVGGRSSITCFVLNNEAYVGSGYDDTWNELSTFYKYTPSTNTWTQVGSLSSGIAMGSGATINGDGYVFSGYPRNGKYWKYTSSDDTFTQLGVTPFFISSASAINFNDKMLHINGYSPTGITNVIWELYIPPPSPAIPTSLNGVVSDTWVNWTWAMGLSGDLNTDSFNVSINDSWTNGSANTYYNHNLPSGGTSTIIVWAYNSSSDILSPASITGTNSTLFIPPDPISLASSTHNLRVNFTFAPGSGNVTDSFNISTNNGTGVVWNNGSSNLFSNTSTNSRGYVEIVVYGYNESNIGTLSIGYLTDNVTIPNNPITITNTGDWRNYRTSTVYVDYDATDPDSDTPTFSCNRIDLFTDFNTSTGIGNWTTDLSDTGIYYVDFGVSDGYGSSDNYTMEITVLDVPEPENLVLGQTGVLYWHPECFYNSIYKFTDGNDSNYAIVGTTDVCGCDWLYLLWDLGEDKQIDHIRWKVAVGTENWPVAYVRLLTSPESPVSYTEIDYHEGSNPYNLSDTTIEFSADDHVRYIKVDINRDNCYGYDSGIFGYELEVWGNDVFYPPPPTPTPTSTSTYRPTVTPIIVVPPTVLPTPEPTPVFELPEELKDTIFEEILVFIGKIFSWLFILAAYFGAFVASVILMRENEDFDDTKYSIFFFGTIGWIVPLIINFLRIVNTVTGNFWLNALIFAAFGFAIYAIFNTFSGKD